MLIFTPQTLYGRIGALLSALIIVLSVLGLTMHRDFYAGKKRSGYFLYYTNLSNLLVFIYFMLISPLLFSIPMGEKMASHAEFAVTMSILLTHFVFHFALLPSIQKGTIHIRHTSSFPIIKADNCIQHYLLPWTVFAYWLICSPRKNELVVYDAFLWTVFPVSYLLYIFLTAPFREPLPDTGSVYPYPFMDPAKHSPHSILVFCLGIYAVSICAGLALIVLIRFLLFYYPALQQFPLILHRT